ncbi:hypothetical protein EV426DRAFT_701469 [Tirmania nivea]|nr:hypothetical protein EV426DRAFT_701469 [Tirmania nivea]
MPAPRLLPRLRHLRRYSTAAPPPRRSRFTRLPARVQRLAAPLRAAPVSHITAFVVLHELTAVLPLCGLWWGLHQLGVAAAPAGEEGEGEGEAGVAATTWRGWVARGEARARSYLEKKGWLAGRAPQDAARLVLEVATAWAIVKALLPLRVAACLWLTPWFARRVVARVGLWLLRWRRR